MDGDTAAPVPFARLVGVVTQPRESETVAELAASPEILNHVGSVHAGALFTLGETATGALLIGLFSDLLAEATVLVRKAEIRYLRPAYGRIVASAVLVETVTSIRDRLATSGRCNFEVEADLHDSDGEQVATGIVEWTVRMLPGAAGVDEDNPSCEGRLK